MLCSFFLGFGLFDLANGAFDGSIAHAQQVGRLLVGLLDDGPFLGFDACHLLLVVGNLLLEVLLALTDILAFVLPISFISCDVLQVFVVVDMLLAHDLSGTLYDGLRQANLSCYLHGKTTSCLSDG